MKRLWLLPTFTIVLLSVVLSSCSSVSPSPSTPSYQSIYLITDSGVVKFSYDEGTNNVTEIASLNASLTGRPAKLNEKAFVVPTQNGYAEIRWDLSGKEYENLGFSPKMIAVYEGSVVAVDDSTILFNGSVVEFDQTVNDVKPGPDALYVASGKNVYTLPGKKPTMASDLETITAIAVDDTGGIYKGLDGKVRTSLGDVNVNGTVEKMVLYENFLYVLTDVNYLYRIDINDLEKSECETNISDFWVEGGKIFYVSNFTGTFGLYDVDSCEPIFRKNILGKDLLGIIVKEE